MFWQFFFRHHIVQINYGTIILPMQWLYWSSFLVDKAARFLG